jgi:Domain of unknown function (DUF2017)
VSGFHRRRGRFVITLEAGEVELLADVVDQVRQLLAARRAEAPDDPLSELTGIATAPSEAPRDPALARLLPDFHREDAELSAAMRVLHEPALLTSKDHAAVTLLDSLPLGGGTVKLSPDDADEWLSALNDVRLALGVRLRMEEDDVLPDLDRPELNGGGQMMFNVYRWLSAIQDSLVEAMLD